MTTPLFLCCLALALVPGCLSAKKSATPRDSGSIPTEVEENFRQRWVARRAAELVATGKAAEAARTEAEAEFRERYEFTKAGQKK